ncbi:MAG: hypothetical protein LBS27_01375 [Bifidobacteriaceae bacterium]|nr:hypothetical protein [Bifidobacteriaceae bacterium]
MVRALAERIARAKGFFALHDDADSLLMYDTLFWLYSHLATATSFEDYFEMEPGQSDYEHPSHEPMMRLSLAADPYTFCTDGHGVEFVRDWWDARVAAGAIVHGPGGYRFADAYVPEVLTALRAIPAAANH